VDLSLEQFAVATGSTLENAGLYHPWAVQAFSRFKIVEPVQMAALCASIAVETANLTAMSESLYYRDADRLARVFRRVFDTNKDKVLSADEIENARAYLRQPQRLSLKLYGGYHGRGGLMLTWERNYALHSLKLGTEYLHYPDLLLQPEHAMLSAASFWDEARCNDVAYDMDEVTLRINGPARLHLAERISQRNAAMKAWA
jgi:putative chitinase